MEFAHRRLGRLLAISLHLRPCTSADAVEVVAEALNWKTLVPFEPLGVHPMDTGSSPNCRYYLRLPLDDQSHAKADPLRYPQ